MSNELPEGTRVRNYGHQYPRALRHGTATVTSHFYNGRHLEYRVRRDEPLEPGGSVDAVWSADGTIPV